MGLNLVRLNNTKLNTKMNIEHELFGELHEQEENGLFGNEHKRQYEAQQEALRQPPVTVSGCTCRNAEIEKDSLVAVYCNNCNAYVQTDG